MTRLEELLLRWQDGSLAEADLRELVGSLASPEGRALLQKEFAFSEEIREALTAAQARLNVQRQANAFETLELQAANLQVPASPADAGAKDRFRPNAIRSWVLGLFARARRRWRVALGMVAAAVALLAVVIVWQNQEDAFAQIEKTADGVTIVRDNQTILNPPSGFELESADQVITPDSAGVVILYAGENSRLQVQPGSRLALEITDDGKRVKLMAGAVGVTVAAQPKGQALQVTTPHAVATAMGTEFSMAVRPDHSRLEVTEGSVRLARREDGKATLVTTGFYVRAGNDYDLVARALLPEPWHSQDIGLAPRSGHAKWEEKRCHIAGSGRDWHDGQDEFHFVYQTLDGDGEIRARVLGFKSKDKRAKAGVVIRENLKSNARTAFLRLNAGRGLEFSRRRGKESKTEKVGEETFPYWMRLVRQGNTITAFKSADGKVWNRTGAGVFELDRRIYIGLGVTSCDKSVLDTAVFDNINVCALTNAPAY